VRLPYPFLALILAAGSAIAAPPPKQVLTLQPAPAIATLQFGALDTDKLGREDADAARAQLPFRYAVAHPVKAVAVSADKSVGGDWQLLSDGRLLWRLAIKADSAVSIDVGFSRWHLPQGAELWFSDSKRSVIYGPYTDANNPRSGGLSLPLVPGCRGNHRAGRASGEAGIRRPGTQSRQPGLSQHRGSRGGQVGE